MLGLGIAAGIGAVIFQDCGYISSRIYMKKNNNAAALVLFTQLLMGAAGLILLPFCWSSAALASGLFWLPLLGTSVGSFGGQYCFFQAEKKIAPSRLAALMGLRVLSLAVVTALFMGAKYSVLQYFAVAMAALSAGVMNYKSGGGFKWGGMGWMAGSLAFYCCSDLSIFALIKSIDTGNIFHSSFIAMSMVNITLMIFSLFFWLYFKYPVKSAIPIAPFATFWLIKQFFLYCCYALVGVVFGNVIMSLRGPFAVLLGYILSKVGSEAQPPLPKAEWIRRGIATCMMAGAIVVYTLG